MGREEKDAQFSLLRAPKTCVHLLLNVLNYRPLGAVPRPSLEPGGNTNYTVCPRGMH